MATKALFPAIRPSLNLDFTKGFVDPRITFTRATTGVATRINPFGLLEAVPGGVPRLDYDPITRACKGLLIEEQRTNLLTYSEQFDNAAWTKTRSTVTANAATAPDGTLTADRFSDDGLTTGQGYLTQSLTFSAIPYVFSFFAKADTFTSVRCYLTDTAGTVSASDATINLANGAISSGSAIVEPIGSGWYRISVTGTPGSSSGSARILLPNDTATSNSLYIWGAQLEAGAFPTSYIPTTTAAVTRAADVATMTGANFSSWHRQDEGTILVEASIPFTATDNRGPIRLDDGTENNRIMLRNNGSGSRLVAQVITAGSVSADIGSIATAISANTNFKSAVSYKADSFAVSFNGISTLTDEAGAVPTVSRLLLGDAQSSNSIKGSTIKRIAFYPAALPTYVQALTS